MFRTDRVYFIICPGSRFFLQYSSSFCRQHRLKNHIDFTYNFELIDFTSDIVTSHLLLFFQEIKIKYFKICTICNHNIILFIVANVPTDIISSLTSLDALKSVLSNMTSS